MTSRINDQCFNLNQTIKKNDFLKKSTLRHQLQANKCVCFKKINNDLLKIRGNRIFFFLSFFLPFFFGRGEQCIFIIKIIPEIGNTLILVGGSCKKSLQKIIANSGLKFFPPASDIFSEGYRRYLALGLTSFVCTYVSAFLFLRFCFLSKRPSL